ncbi:MAG: MCE family protein [Myxococcales bacterium]|nr:MCE family protein [Myxococcales bacterium]
MSMNQDDGYRLAKVGAFVLVALVSLVLVIGLVGRSRSLFSRKALLHTSFENISGLVVGAPVRLAGVDIGIVQRIQFDRDPKIKKVHVLLGVQSKYLDRIRGDSIARLSSKGLLGDMIINITVGSPEFPALKSGDELKAAESEGLTEIVSSLQDGIGQVRDLVGHVDDRVRVVLSDQVARDLGRVVHSTANILEGVERGSGLLHDVIYKPKLAENVVTLTGDAQQIAANLNRTIKRVDELVAAVTSKPGTLHDLIYKDDGSKLVGELTQLSGDLAAIVGEIRKGKGTIHSLVYDDNHSLANDLSAAARILRTLAEETQQGKGTLGGLLKDPTLYEDLKLILGKVKRNAVLRMFIRSAIQSEGLKRSNEPAVEPRPDGP